MASESPKRAEPPNGVAKRTKIMMRRLRVRHHYVDKLVALCLYGQVEELALWANQGEDGKHMS